MTCTVYIVNRHELTQHTSSIQTDSVTSLPSTSMLKTGLSAPGLALCSPASFLGTLTEQLS